MLRHLAIRHFAIISEVEIEVPPGFTAITGETGAGKSILIDALGLLLGDRAESGLIAADSEQAELEAVFTLTEGEPARRWLAEQALDEGEELIIRRVLTASSGSRAWINGRSATVGQLAELGGLLVEIHGQHEHQQLEKPATQRCLLDRRIEQELVAAVAGHYERWRKARTDLSEFDNEAGDPQQLELLRFQVRELTDLDLAEGEFEALELEQERLARIDEVRLAIATAGNALDSDDGPNARAQLLQALAALEPVRELEPGLQETARMLEEARINIDEALAVLEREEIEDDGDPERLVAVNRRLETALDLARKHRVSPAELPALSDRLGQQLERLENQGERRKVLNEAVSAAEMDWQNAARALSEARLQTAGTLSEAVGERLAALGMDNARLEFAVTPIENAEPSPHGRDRIRIEFSANPGQPPQTLSRVASGGELSRIALALMVSSDGGEGPNTRIFDEVDAGVGGETAHVVGRFLHEVAEGGQAMCVTHLAQVAARADHQLRVVKRSQGDGTALRVEALDAGQRRSEIARMLGNADSKKGLAHAAELLGGK